MVTSDIPAIPTTLGVVVAGASASSSTQSRRQATPIGKKARMDDDDLHLSRIQTAWSMVRRAHGDHTAVQAAQQSLLDRYGGAVRRYALAALRDEDAADEVFQEFALRFVRGDFGNADPERGPVPGVREDVCLSADRRLPTAAEEAVARRAHALEHGRTGCRSDDEALGDDAHVPSQLARRAVGPLLAEAGRRGTAAPGKPHHTVLRYRVDHPDLHSPELAAGFSEKLGKPINAGAARVLLHRARDGFAELLLDEVMQSLTEDSLDEAEEELIELDLLEYCRPASTAGAGRIEPQRHRGHGGRNKR